MEMNDAIYGLCARCGTEIKDRYPKFFLPTPKTNGKIRSCECCSDCFKAFIEGPPNTLVEIRFKDLVVTEWKCIRCGAVQHASKQPENCLPLDQGGCDRRGGMVEKGKAPRRW